MVWPLWVALAFVLVAATLAGSEARALIRYELDGTRQVLSVELRLIFGLWLRHWRVPPHGTVGLHRSGLFGHGVQQETVPGRDPHRRPRAGLRSPTWRGVDYLRGRVSLRELRIDAKLGTGDAATSALAVGLVHALLHTGIALLPAYFRMPAGFAPEVGLVPDYTRTRLQVHADCIVQTRLGHLTYAVLLALRQSWRAHPARGPGHLGGLRPRRAAGG